MYPGLKSHPNHLLMKTIMNTQYGFGGILAIDLIKEELAESLMEKMQEQNVGLLAVSLGYFKTLFSLPGNSTSSEISDEDQIKMGLSKGIIRLSIGIDNNIHHSLDKMINCMTNLKILKK